MYSRLRLNLAKAVSLVFLLFPRFASIWAESSGENGVLKGRSLPKCDRLLPGQFLCRPPVIDKATQQPEGCVENIAYVDCYPAPGISCCQDFSPSSSCDTVFTQLTRSEATEGDKFSPANFTAAFRKKIPCVSTDGHDFKTALLLSVFLGMFGADRFYLGYPALGLIKLSTLGFFFLGQLIDVILIATQVVGPASGKGYVMDLYGARLNRLQVNELTYFYADFVDN